MEVKIGVKMEVKVEVKRYAQDVCIVNWYRPFLLPLLLPFLLPFLLPPLPFTLYPLTVTYLVNENFMLTPKSAVVVG